MKKTMLTGVRPSGNLTLGNYLGAIKNFVDRQEKYNSYIFIADLHAITNYIEPHKLKESVKNSIAMYLACGVDPQTTTIFRQSDVLEHGNLGFIMTFQMEKSNPGLTPIDKNCYNKSYEINTFCIRI